MMNGLSKITQMMNMGTQIRVQAANNTLTPEGMKNMQKQLNEIRVEINAIRNDGIPTDFEETSLSTSEANKMIQNARQTILKFSGDSQYAQSNIPTNDVIGLLQ